MQVAVGEEMGAGGPANSREQAGMRPGSGALGSHPNSSTHRSKNLGAHTQLAGS